MFEQVMRGQKDAVCALGVIHQHKLGPAFGRRFNRKPCLHHRHPGTWWHICGHSSLCGILACPATAVFATQQPSQPPSLPATQPATSPTSPPLYLSILAAAWPTPVYAVADVPELATACTCFAQKHGRNMK